MLLRDDPAVHLAYCQNVHPGETWEENFAAIREKALAVRGLVQQRGAAPFGLGLRLGHRAARALSEPETLADFRRFLAEQNLYVFTINGFPFGQFHHGRVKENVYAPDWRQPERAAYTMLLADILAALLPEGISGSISTVPGSWKPWISSAEDVEKMTRGLMDCVIHCGAIFQRTGREIHLGLEPEPGCFLETTEETIRFFNGKLFTRGHDFLRAKTACSEQGARDLIGRHLGVCLDTCHAAMQFEDAAESLARLEREGIRISKVQLSAALRARGPGAHAAAALGPWSEPTYLHQVKARRLGAEPRLLAWDDLPEAVAAFPEDIEEARAHFHVPLFWENFRELSSTATLLDGDFFARLRTGAVEHLEMETYTWGVLPAELRTGGVVEGIAREYEWALARLREPRPPRAG